MMGWLECPAGEFRALARALLDQGHCVRLRVSGGSMHPSVRSGDLVDIRPAGPEDVCAGDLVLFALGERLFLHRAIGRQQVGDEVRLLARGDSHVEPEPEFGPMELLGVAVAVRRGEAVIDLELRRNRWLGWVMARCWPVQRIVLKAARRWPGSGSIAGLGVADPNAPV